MADKSVFIAADEETKLRAELLGLALEMPVDNDWLDNAAHVWFHKMKAKINSLPSRNPIIPVSESHWYNARMFVPISDKIRCVVKMYSGEIKPYLCTYHAEYSDGGAWACQTLYNTTSMIYHKNVSEFMPIEKTSKEHLSTRVINDGKENVIRA